MPPKDCDADEAVEPIRTPPLGPSGSDAQEIPDDVQLLASMLEGCKQFKAQDSEGEGHRARVWKGSTAHYFGDENPIEIVRREQALWVEEHPEQLLKWSFPTKRRDCFRINFRSIEKMESLTSKEFRGAWGSIVCGCPSIVARGIGFMYLNYLQPHHKRIQTQGRHLLMLKVYEAKSEIHFWHIPLKEARELHVQSAEAMRGGVSLNDVQLLETYAVDSTFVLHAETFARLSSNAKESSHHGSQYGECTWVGGMAIHLVKEDKDDPVLNRSREFAMVPEEELADLMDKQVKLREKRSRKKANQKAKKDLISSEQAEEDRVVREMQAVAAAGQRKKGLIQPHEGFSKMLQEESVAQRKDGLIRPHESLSRLFKSERDEDDDDSS